MNVWNLASASYFAGFQIACFVPATKAVLNFKSSRTLGQSVRGSGLDLGCISGSQKGGVSRPKGPGSG